MIEDTKETQPSTAAAKPATPKVSHRDLSRLCAIPMLGLGAAICISVEFFQTHVSGYAALPLIVGPALALVGLLMLLRGQLREARAEKERKAGCQRIASYRPVMADGSNGSAALSLVLAPAGEICSEPPRRRSVARAQAVARAPRSQSEAPYGGNVRQFPPAHLHAAAHRAPVRTSSRQGRSATASLADAMHFGSEWAQDLDLSPRALARLEADPFVKRLARIS